MEVFSELIFSLSRTPEWVYLLAIPLCTLAAAVAFALARLRRAYPVFAGGAVAVGTALTAARGGSQALVYCGLACALYALFALFLLLPPLRRRRESREERIYKKFHAELEEPAPPQLPPKVCCYAEPATAEESGMRLAYATSLIAKLKACKLVPADRLELETLGRSVEACRGKALTQDELGVLNDNLASVLKLMAKYKL